MIGPANVTGRFVLWDPRSTPNCKGFGVFHALRIRSISPKSHALLDRWVGGTMSGNLRPLRNGVWEARIDAGRDLTTVKRRQVSRTIYGTKRDAQKVLECDGGRGRLRIPVASRAVDVGGNST